MEIVENNFSEERIERYCMGAGVIPISTDEKGDIHILLGRERWIPQWKGSCRWSGFEGSRKQNEDVVSSATREFMEESMGVVEVVPATADRSHKSLLVAHRLRAKLFWRRIVLRIQSDRRPERYHCTYVVPVPWDPTVCARFQELRSKIEQLDRLVQEFHFSRPSCLGEMGEYIGNIKVNEDGSVYATKMASTAPCILRRPWSLVDDDTEIVCATFDQDADVRSIVDWSTVRERLERAILPHPCVSFVRDGRWNHIQHVSIQRDYIEKDQIRWWTIDDLNAVISGKGQLGPERFRPYFLPVLQTVLMQMGVWHRPLRCEPVQPDSSTEEEQCESPEWKVRPHE